MQIFLFPIGGAVVGFLLGWRLDLLGMILVAISIVAYIGYTTYRDRNRRKTSGDFGALFIAAITLIPFFLVLFVTSFAFNHELILPEIGNILGWFSTTFLR